jgi:hypothetical protein
VIRPKFQILLVVQTMLLSFAVHSAEAQVVPGRGNLLTIDDFEAADWGCVYNLPKSSKEEDEQVRYPLGGSTNGKWKEGPKRGIPDVVKTVECPEGGLPGSSKALLLRSKDTGIPGRLSYSQKQDDFVMVSRSLAVGYTPSVVSRIYLPDWEEWENRNGIAFGFRIGLQGPYKKVPEEDENFRLFKRQRAITVIEPYYPGFFLQFNPKEQYGEDHATLIIRADQYGRDIPGPTIKETGWWTFGMSVTPDARVHYYAKPGVEDLTEADFISSSLPYGIPGQHFNTLFFNTCNGDDGQTWSTPILIDDTAIYYGTSVTQPQTQQITQRPGAAVQR